MLPTPVADNSRGLPSDGTDYQSLMNAVMTLLPTPAVNDMGAAYTPEQWDAWTAEMKAKHNNGNGRGPSLNVEVQWMLLPTPRATDGTKGGPNQRGSSGDLMLPSAVSGLVQVDEGDMIHASSISDGVEVGSPSARHEREASCGEGGSDSSLNLALVCVGLACGNDGECLHGPTVSAGEREVNRPAAKPADWGEYESAVRRWESLTRPAPAPTKLGAKGNPKLSDEFDEWLMGYPAGWITDVPGVTWNEALKACGNGVVPQQGSAAVRHLRVMASWAVAA